jgi:hypothetical protein
MLLAISVTHQPPHQTEAWRRRDAAAGEGVTTFRLTSNLSLRSDACAGEETRSDPRATRRSGGWGKGEGAHVLVEEVAVDGPVEGVLEGTAVEQAHPLLLHCPPRQETRRRRHGLMDLAASALSPRWWDGGNGDWTGGSRPPLTHSQDVQAHRAHYQECSAQPTAENRTMLQQKKTEQIRVRLSQLKISHF